MAFSKRQFVHFVGIKIVFCYSFHCAFKWMLMFETKNPYDVCWVWFNLSIFIESTLRFSLYFHLSTNKFVYFYLYVCSLSAFSKRTSIKNSKSFINLSSEIFFSVEHTTTTESLKRVENVKQAQNKIQNTTEHKSRDTNLI